MDFTKLFLIIFLIFTTLNILTALFRKVIITRLYSSRKITLKKEENSKAFTIHLITWIIIFIFLLVTIITGV